MPPKSRKVVDVVHKNAPRGACQITVKCSVKKILSVVLVKVVMALKLRLNLVKLCMLNYREV